MTTPTAEPSTALTVPKPSAIGNLPPQYQAALAIRKAEAMMFAEVSKQSWGNTLDRDQRRAIAAFCQRNNLDPSMIDFLGGKLYRNANFWLDRLAKLVAAGLVEYAYADFITADPRIDRIAADESDPQRAAAYRTEKHRREDERVKYQVPDEALAACVFRVKLKGMTEVTGCKPVMASGNDPVGKANPVLTAETRSARRALRKVIEVSPEVKQLYETVEVEWKTLETQVQIPAGDVEEEGPAPSPASRVTPLVGGDYATPEAPPMRKTGEEGDDQADLLQDQKIAEKEAQAELKRR